MSIGSAPRRAPLQGEPVSRGNAIRRFYQDSSLGAVVTAAVIVAVVGVAWAGPSYFSIDNLTNLTQFVSLPLIVGAFASVGLIAGVVDLSIGAMVGFSAALFSILGAQHVGVWPAAIITVVAALIGGALNGLAVVIFGADSIAATVGMLTILSGITLALVGSTPPTFVVDGLFNFSYAAFGPFSLLFLVGAAACVVLALGITFTRPGRHLRAAGGDANAATRAGIPVNRLRFAAFLVSSFGAAIAGIFYIGQNGGAAADTGLDFTFQVTAALMIGGFSVVRGGIGNPLGGLFGLLVIGGVGVLLDIKQIDSHFLDMVLGVTLIIAVLVDRLRGGDRFD